MSGNSTRAAVGVASGTGAAAIAGALIASFVGGVIVGSLVGAWAGRRRRRSVIGFVSTLLAAAAGAHVVGLPVMVSALLMAAAMGAENAVFERAGDVGIGLTYMTGTLVKTGQRLTAALRGGDRWGWLPFLLLWLGLVAGAVLGALSYRALGLHALWIATAWAAVLALLAGRYAPYSPQSSPISP